MSRHATVSWITQPLQLNEFFLDSETLSGFYVGMIETEITIVNKLGLHARAAAKLAATAGRFGCAIKTGKNGKLVDAKSVMSLMLLAASQGTTLNFLFDGGDEVRAHEAVRTLIHERFGEEQ